MASFDIQSLFTNIPLDETIEFVCNFYLIKRGKLKACLKNMQKKLLTNAVKSSTFMFNDVYYKQVDGVAMGSPLGPTLANLFLVYYESK